MDNTEETNIRSKRNRIQRRSYSPVLERPKRRKKKKSVVNSNLIPLDGTDGLFYYPPSDEDDDLAWREFSTADFPKKKDKSKKVPAYKRPNLPKSVTMALNEWFLKHIEDPYPTEMEKAAMMNEHNLTPIQVNNWFSNKRIRYKRKLLEGAQEVFAMVQPDKHR